MQSYFQLALSILGDKKSSVILQKDLLAQIATTRNTTKERVRGSIIKHRGGLLNPKVLSKLGLVRERSPARFVRGTALEVPHLNSYECPVKRQVVKKILSYISSDTPIFATLAGHEGLDVEQFLSKFPLGTAMNFERDEEIAKKFSAKFPTVRTTIGDFDLASTLACDLAFFDSLGYACKSMHNSVKKFNDTRKVKVLALTLIDIKRFRNRGDWVNWAKQKFQGEDPTLDWAKDTMSNYDLVEEIKYTKTNVKGARGMRVLIFRRES